jgi:hypothetical protein
MVVFAKLATDEQNKYKNIVWRSKGSTSDLAFTGGEVGHQATFVHGYMTLNTWGGGGARPCSRNLTQLP